MIQTKRYSPYLSNFINNIISKRSFDFKIKPSIINIILLLEKHKQQIPESVRIQHFQGSYNGGEWRSWTADLMRLKHALIHFSYILQ